MFGSQARPGLGSLGGGRCGTLAGTSLDGDSLDAPREYTLEPLGNAALASFGKRAAKRMIAGIQQLPAKDRASAMKQAMKKIDPGLAKRTETISRAARARGAHPQAALEHGLATALSEGMAGELAKRGRRIRSSQSGQLRGLGGLRGHVALGATASLPGSVACSADGNFVYEPGPPPYTRRIMVGEVCATKTGASPAVHGGAGGVTGGPVTAPGTYTGRMLQVGPFQVPVDAQSFMIHWTGLLPQDWRDFISAELQHDCSGCVSSSMRPTVGHSMGILSDFLGSQMPAQVNKDFLSGPIFGGDSKIGSLGILQSGDVSNQNPIVFVKHPDTGDDYGLYIWIDLKDPTQPPTGPTGANPYVMTLVWRKVDRSWYTDAWNWIKHVVAYVVNTVLDEACLLLNSGQLASGAKTNPYVAGGEVALRASGLCPAPPPPPTDMTPPWLLPVALVGGAGLVFIMVLKRIRKAP